MKSIKHTIKYVGLDLHDTVLIDRRGCNQANVTRSKDTVLDEYFLQTQKDYFSYWIREDGLSKSLNSFKKYLLLDDKYVINPEFAWLLQHFPNDRIFIFSNCVDIEQRIKKKFNELKNIKFFFATKLGYFKPNPRSYTLIAKELNVSSKQVLFCGDNYFNDYLAPKLANMNAILYKRNTSSGYVPKLFQDYTRDLIGLL